MEVIMKRFFILTVLVFTFVTPISGAQQQIKKQKIDLKGKKILMIIAHQNFRDEEYQQPREILEAAGAQVIVASSSTKKAKGMLGLTVKPDTLLKDVKAANFDAILFIGGSGAKEYWDNPIAHQLAKDAITKDKILGAICIAPVTLAKAGVLKDKRATVFSSTALHLRKQGVKYTGHDVEVDGKIVTANGPAAARKFGEMIVKLLMKSNKILKST